MVSQELAKGMEIPMSMEISFCEKCVERKMSRKTFKSVGEIRSMRRLQRVLVVMCVALIKFSRSLRIIINGKKLIFQIREGAWKK